MNGVPMSTTSRPCCQTGRRGEEGGGLHRVGRSIAGVGGAEPSIKASGCWRANGGAARAAVGTRM